MPKMRTIFTKLLLLFNFSKFTHSLGDASEWTYEKDGPMGIGHWPGICQTGKAQSPINIEAKEAVPMCAKRGLNLNDAYYWPLDDVQLVNTGHTLQLQSPELNRRIISGGGLNDEYSLQQIHLHWAPEDGNGSEHTFGGRHFPVEMHLVHAIRGWDTARAIDANAHNGLLVVSVLFEAGDMTSSLTLNSVLRTVQFHKDVLYESGTAFVDDSNFVLRNILPTNFDNYFMYNWFPNDANV